MSQRRRRTKSQGLNRFDQASGSATEEGGELSGGSWRSRSRSPIARVSSPGCDVLAVPPVACDVQPPDLPKFVTITFEVGAEVGAFGFSVSPVVQGWRDITINNIVTGSWAAEKGLKLGDEILKVNNVDVLGLDSAGFVEHMKVRPLKLVILHYNGTVRSTEPDAEIDFVEGVTRTRELSPQCEFLKLTSLKDYEYVYMSRSANKAFILPIKNLASKSYQTTKAILVETEIWIDKPFHEYVSDLEDVVSYMARSKAEGDAKHFLEAGKLLPTGFWGTLSQGALEDIWQWPTGEFDPAAKNVDFQFNVGLLSERDEERENKPKVRLLRHFYNLRGGLKKSQLEGLAGTCRCALNWTDIGDYRARGHQSLQMALTQQIGGITFQSKRLSKTRLPQNIPAEVPADRVEVKELVQWLKDNGDADVADRSVFSVFYAQEYLKPDSKLKSLKAVGIGREECRGIILDHQSKGAKGSAEINDWNLTFEDFDLERLPWLKAAVEHFKENRTQGPVMSGPRKCGKTQFLITLCYWVSMQEKQCAIDNDEPGADNMQVGVLVSNDKDNFSRSLRSKKNRSQLLDDPKLNGWSQADWLGWLDLVAVGVSAASRYENTPLTGFRGMATNRNMLEMFFDHHGRAMTPAEVDAIKNKGFFLDLYDEAKLSQMRKSTWYRDSCTGEAVPIMLTVEGERKVRERFHLECPDPAGVDVPASAPSMPNPAEADMSAPAPSSPATTSPVLMQLSPRTFRTLSDVIGANASSDCSSSSGGGIVLSGDICSKLRQATRRISCGDTSGDSLAPEH